MNEHERRRNKGKCRYGRATRYHFQLSKSSPSIVFVFVPEALRETIVFLQCFVSHPGGHVQLGWLRRSASTDKEDSSREKDGALSEDLWSK
ncbi:hypothetical protein RRG08_029129 [Elysia crispata]|uniref:Uncharacterized protein n=1 Tax=Elysia crispata TaxID=231223 RepID=A0AAE0Y6G0_9GAST|nr:hypothetical protein RRG08_029129 [Elysia crispata]